MRADSEVSLSAAAMHACMRCCRPSRPRRTSTPSLVAARSSTPSLETACPCRTRAPAQAAGGGQVAAGAAERVRSAAGAAGGCWAPGGCCSASAGRRRDARQRPRAARLAPHASAAPAACWVGGRPCQQKRQDRGGRAAAERRSVHRSPLFTPAPAACPRAARPPPGHLHHAAGAPPGRLPGGGAPDGWVLPCLALSCLVFVFDRLVLSLT